MAETDTETTAPEGTEKAAENGPPNTVKRVSDSLSRVLGAQYQPGEVAGGIGDKALRDRLNQRLVSMELRRQQNIESVAQAAFEAAGVEQAGAEEPVVDEDWLVRFIDLAKDVSNPDMHQVWGHVLAREQMAPGTFSIQAVECLAEMSPADIDLWERVGRIAFPTGYLIKIGGRNHFDDFGVSQEDIARLQVLSLVQQSEDLSVTFYAPTKGLTFDFRGFNLIVRHPESKMFTLPAFKFTPLGVELLGTLADVPVDRDYVEALGEDMKGQGYDFRLRANGT